MENDVNKPEIIICDIDGTVADCEHRRKYIDDVIRIGDTVYIKNYPNAKQFPKVVTELGLDSFGLYAALDKHHSRVGQHEIRKKKDYKKFFESCKDDSPIQTTIDIVTALSPNYRVIFMSGRPDSCRQDTIDWLNKYMPGLRWPFNAPIVETLFMRPTGDMRQDYIVKEELYRKYIEPFYNVKLVLDDRDQVVSMWRDRLGLTCWQVNKGDF
jgi:hypothetical protein